jgi:hypothetical protein
MNPTTKKRAKRLPRDIGAVTESRWTQYFSNKSEYAFLYSNDWSPADLRAIADDMEMRAAAKKRGKS